MAYFEHLEIFKQGFTVWNDWRMRQPKGLVPGLNGANLENADLTRFNLKKINLREADLRGVNLKDTDLGGANITGADLTGAVLDGADLYMAKLNGAHLRETSLNNVNLSEADLTLANLQASDLSRANLRGANLGRTLLEGTNFNQATLWDTIFYKVDLSRAKGLDTCIHQGPSCLDNHTLLRSKVLPAVFLRGCGLPDRLIEYLPSLFQFPPIQFYSCFISHSAKDHGFAERLYADFQNKGVRCWYAPEEMKGGEKIFDQIDSAIRVHDKLLLVLSEHSLKSEWVLTEIRRCRKAEKREGKRKLFPIRLVDLEAIQDWECFDADSGKDLAVEVREFFLPDFSNWKDHDAYKKAFDRLLRDLKESAEQELSLS